MAQEERGFTLRSDALSRVSKATRWVEKQMRSGGYDFADTPGEAEEGDIVPSYVRVTGSPATGMDTTWGIYPGMYVRFPGTGGTGDADDIHPCYVRDVSGLPLMASPGTGQGPYYSGHVYTTHGTGSLVLVGGGGCTGGTSPTGATCDTSCTHTLIYDTCNGDVVTRSTLIMNFGVPTTFCLSQSTGPAPPCPTGPTGPAGAGVNKTTRAVPVVVGQSVELGSTTLGTILDVSVNGGTAFQMSKLYNTSHAYDTADPNNWYEIRPTTAPQPYGTGHDFTLDVKRNGSEQTYRVRRVAGTTPATASVDIYTGGSFTGSSGTGATAAVGYAPNSVITQTNHRVAVGKLNTEPPLMLLDLGSPGSGGANDGIAFNCDSSNIGTRLINFRRSGSDRMFFGYDGSLDFIFVLGSALHSWWGRSSGFNTTSIIIDGNGTVNPVRVSQLATSPGVVSVQATGAGEIVTQLELLPSGSVEDETRFRLHNFSVYAHSGRLDLKLNGATGSLDPSVAGIGTLPNLFDFNIACRHTLPVTFTSAGTATFASIVNFEHSFTLVTPGFGGKLKVTNAGDFTSAAFRIQPTSGNLRQDIDLLPSGTNDSSQVHLYNGSDPANSGSIRLKAEGATGWMESVTGGAGVAMNRFNWESPPIFFGSAGTATFTSRATFNNGFTLESAGGAAPMLFTQRSASAASSTVRLQPLGGNATSGLQLVPSGTEVAALLQMANAGDTANCGFFQIHVSSVVELSAFQGGTGVAPTRVDVKLPATFTSTGTATFTSQAVFDHSLTLVSPGFGGRVKITNRGGFTTSNVTLQPDAGDMESHLSLYPSGTGDRSVLALGNGSDFNNHSILRLEIDGANAAMLNITGGTGTAITNFIWSLAATKFVGNLGFFDTTPISKPTVTGSRAGGAALASLLTALANLGLITDSSTA